MSDLSKMKEILGNQQKKGIESGDWKRLDYRIGKTDEDITLIINNLKIGFVFTFRGRLIGIYNWKDY